jgi:CubicO group peptidase (beta-lactamase class C family)
MKNIRVSRLAILLFAGLFFASGARQVRAQQASKKVPAPAKKDAAEELGFSSERLERLHAVMQRQVDEKQLPGIVTILARHGKAVEEKTYGKKDIASGAVMTRDTIFRIYSMTKPVTGVAMMILYEEGKWHPSDPVSKYIPEFAHLKVFKGVDESGNMILEEPVHPPTMSQLMTHTAGFTYGFFGNTPVDKLYRSERVLESQSLQEMIDKLAKMPLLYQPGTRWVYSVSMDIQGYLVEKLSGQSLPDFMQKHIFEPLGMKDSGFYVSKEKRNRFATSYSEKANGELVSGAMADGLPTDYAAPPSMASGGGGMVSTAQDYLRFAQMLLNGGELDGVRILGPETVKLMTSNHIDERLETGDFPPLGPQPGLGWGYDCAVYHDPRRTDEIVGKGTFFWVGAADTWFWVDPTNDIVFIGMTQRLLGPHWPNVENLTHAPVYQALLQPKI